MQHRLNSRTRLIIHTTDVESITPSKESYFTLVFTAAESNCGLDTPFPFTDTVAIALAMVAREPATIAPVVFMLNLVNTRIWVRRGPEKVARRSQRKFLNTNAGGLEC